MEDLTFGEQVKIILGRKGMTDRRADRKEDVPSESDPETWEG